LKIRKSQLKPLQVRLINAMGIFSSKKNTKEKKTPAKGAVVVEKKVVTQPASFNDVLLRPHITEKAGIKASEENVYTFEVTKGASKPSIRKAIIDLYKVTPVKIATITITGKRVVMRGKAGVTKATKKALIYLKKGETIEFV